MPDKTLSEKIERLKIAAGISDTFTLSKAERLQLKRQGLRKKDLAKVEQQETNKLINKRYSKTPSRPKEAVLESSKLEQKKKTQKEEFKEIDKEDIGKDTYKTRDYGKNAKYTPLKYRQAVINCPQNKLAALKEKVAYYVQDTDKGKMPMPTTAEESDAIAQIIARAKKRRGRKTPI